MTTVQPFRIRVAGAFLCVCLFLFPTASAAFAQWTVTILHPHPVVDDFPDSSEAWGVHGTQQAGNVMDPSTFRMMASIWNSTAASWVSIHPPALMDDDSSAFGTSGTHQVGFAGNSLPDPISGFGGPHASMWSGTAASWVDLHPTVPPFGAAFSFGFGVAGDQQVGLTYIFTDASFSIRPVASLWTGTAASWVNLDPPLGSVGSAAYATSGTRQVGMVSFGFGNTAAMWSGTAASYVSLHPGHLNTPTFAVGQSEARGISGSQQVGYTEVATPTSVTTKHACLWNDTATSWVDLHPTGAAWSDAWGTTGTEQVGDTAFGDDELHASVWSGTAASWENLSLTMPGRWRQTSARGIWRVGHTVYVVGHGVLHNGDMEAVLWTKTACAADFNNSGTLSVQDIFDFLAAYFDNDPRADFNISGTLSVQDIFDYLAAYFAGCD